MAHWFFIYSALFAVGVGLFSGVSAYGQTLPGSADPSRFQQRFSIPGQEEDRQIVKQEIAGPTRPIPEVPEGFVLKDVELEGVTAFEPDRFAAIVAEYKGRKVDLNALNHLADRITHIYQDEGYFLSRAIVPEQKVKDGIVTIQAIEGFVQKIILDDPDGFLQRDQLHIFFDTIAIIKNLIPLHGPTLERYILLLNDASGIAVYSFLKEPAEPAAAGAVDVVLKVQKRPSEAVLGYSNYGSRFVGPHQVSASWSGGRILTAFDSLNVQGTAAIPFSEVEFDALTYTLPLAANGLTAKLSVSRSSSHPGYTLKPLEVEGDSANVDFGLSYPLIRSRRENLYIHGDFSVLNSATQFLDEELIDDKLRILSLGMSYNKQDDWNGISNLSLTLNHGMDILRATKTGADKLSRTEGRSDFWALDMTAERRQDLEKDLEGVQLVAGLKAQYAPHPLLSSQEFGYGGTDFGRAYDPSEITGDQGMATSIELRYTNIPTIKDLNLKLVPFTFYDIGKVWNKDTGSKPQSAASAGFGTYYNFSGRIDGSLQVAWPLTKSVDTPVMNGEDGPRWLFNLSARF